MGDAAPKKDGKRAVKCAQLKSCEICGYDKFTQRHRILPGKEGGKYRLSNVAYLCGNCHWEADRGWISRERLQAIVDARLAGGEAT